MLLTNHTLTGILIGLVEPNPAIGFPLGVGSHLALDMTPHFGPARPWDWRDPRFLIVGSLDFASTLALTAAAIWLVPDRAVSIAAAVFGATLPDLTYIPLILFTKERVCRWLPWYKPMLRFLGRIQWYERPPGLITEVVWFALMVWLLSAYSRALP